MSADDWTREHHLTPQGWVKGTYKYYGKVQGQIIPRPTDAVESWEEHCTQSSMWSSEKYSSVQLWHDSAVSKEERATLHERFPTPFS